MQDTRQMIVQAFLELLKTKSFLNISIVNIMNKCQLSRQTFYRYFIDINDLVAYTHEFIIDESIKQFAEDKSFKNSFYNSLRLFKKYKVFYCSIVEYSGQNDFFDWFYHSMIKGCLEHIGPHRIDEKTSFELEVYWLGATWKLVEWIRGGMTLEPEVMSEYLYCALPEDIKCYFKD